MYDIICAGVACLDIVVSGNVSTGVFHVDSTPVENISFRSGGDASNQAVTAASLGLRTGLVSCVGNDGKGKQLLDILNSKGVDTSLVDTQECDESVSAIVLVNDDGSRNFLFTRGCGTTYLPSSRAVEAVSQARILSIGSFFVMPEFDKKGARTLLEQARSSGVITVADMTCDTLGEGFTYIGEYLYLIDYLMPSYEEASAITGESEPEAICAVFRERGATNIIIKLGSQGCYISSDGRDRIIPVTAGTRVVDTTGCGDNFVAAFCYGLLQEWSLDECARFAHGASAINASHLGASGHISSAQEVLDLINSRT